MIICAISEGKKRVDFTKISFEFTIQIKFSVWGEILIVNFSV